MRESTERTYEIDKADSAMVWEKTWGDKKCPVCVQVVEYGEDHNKTRFQFSLSRTSTVNLIKRLLETINESDHDFPVSAQIHQLAAVACGLSIEPLALSIEGEDEE